MATAKGKRKCIKQSCKEWYFFLFLWNDFSIIPCLWANDQFTTINCGRLINWVLYLNLRFVLNSTLQ